MRIRLDIPDDFEAIWQIIGPAMRPGETFVVSTNERAARLWQSLDFAIVGRLPGAFRHPNAGFVDALVMFRPVTSGRNDDR